MGKALTNHERETIRCRIKTLLQTPHYHGVEAGLAADMKISCASLNTVIRRNEEPGPKYWHGLSGIPRINLNWVNTGLGEPFSAAKSDSLQQAIPVAGKLPEHSLNGTISLQSERAESMMGELAGLESTFWFEFNRRLAAGRIGRLVGAREGDRFLFASNREQFPATEEFDDTLCAVRNRWSNDGRCVLGLVSFEVEDETGWSRLEADTFEGLEGERGRDRSDVESRLRSDSIVWRRPTQLEMVRRSPSVINQSDVVAVWTGHLKRN